MGHIGSHCSMDKQCIYLGFGKDRLAERDTAKQYDHLAVYCLSIKNNIP